MMTGRKRIEIVRLGKGYAEFYCSVTRHGFYFSGRPRLYLTIPWRVSKKLHLDCRRRVKVRIETEI